MKKVLLLVLAISLFSCSTKEEKEISVVKESYENHMIDGNYYYVTNINGNYTANVQNFPKGRWSDDVFKNIILFDKEINAGDIVEAYQIYQTNGTNRDISGIVKIDIVFGIKKVTERFPKDSRFDAPNEKIREVWTKESQKKARFLCEVSAPIVWTYTSNSVNSLSSVLVYSDDLSSVSYHIVSTYIPSKKITWERIYVVSGTTYDKLNSTTFQYHNYYEYDTKEKKWIWKKRIYEVKHPGGF